MVSLVIVSYGNISIKTEWREYLSAAGDSAEEEGQHYCVRCGYTAACVAAPIAGCATETRQNNGPRMPLPSRLLLPGHAMQVSNPPSLHLEGAQHACLRTHHHASRLHQ